jgi:gas vesicle protein
MEIRTVAGFGIGLATGAIIGGVIALLLAPKPGKETRQLIKDNATDSVDAFKEKAGEMIDLINEAASQASRKGQAAVRALKS